MTIEAHVPGRYVAATWKNVILFYWTGDATDEGVERLVQISGKLRGLGGFSAVHLIKEGVGLPNAGVRKALQDGMTRFEKDVCCLAVVLLGSGFWASALQGALTGVRMLAPMGDSLMRFSSDTSRLREWFLSEHQKRTGELLDEAQLQTFLRQLRALGDAQPANDAR